MVSFPTTYDLGKLLTEEDFPLPAECIDVRIEMPVDGCFEIIYRCHLTGEDLETIGKVFAKMGAAVIQRSKP